MIAAMRRVALEPVLVRLGVLAAGVTALVLAAPAGLPPLVPVGLGVAAVLPAIRPAGPWATLVMLAAGIGWLVEPGSPAELLLLAGALYLLHTLAALAATLPYDAEVSADLLARWLVRTLGVLVTGAVLMAAVLAGLSQLPAGQTYLAATLAGLALAVALIMRLRGGAAENLRRMGS